MPPYFFLGIVVGIILGVVITVFFALCARSGQLSDQEIIEKAKRQPPTTSS